MVIAYYVTGNDGQYQIPDLRTISNPFGMDVPLQKQLGVPIVSGLETNTFKFDIYIYIHIYIYSII